MTPEYVAQYARDRRAQRKAAGDCINHLNRRATHGRRCFDCWLVHRYGVTAIVTIPLRVDLLAYDLRRISAA